MEISSANWFSELEMEDPSNFINQYHDDQYSFDHGLNNFQSNNFSSDQSYSNFISDCEIIRPLKQLKTNNWINSNNNHDVNIHQLNTSTKSSSSSSSQLISFEKYATSSSAKPKEEPIILSNNNNNNNWSSSGQLGQSNSSSVMMKRSGINAQDHVLAERKRREKLSQKFISLSALLPGLKKMDKASVLGDAIKHIKNLQERVNKLEEKTSTKTVESFVFVKRSQIISSDDENSSISEENNNNFNNDNISFPEIEAKVSEKDVLIRIHCENQRGCLANVFAEIEKLQLSILNTSVLPFGGSTLHITIVAQMDVDFQMKVKDLVKKLRQALLIKN